MFKICKNWCLELSRKTKNVIYKTNCNTRSTWNNWPFPLMLMLRMKKKIISKRKISNSSFMSALIMRMCIIIYYSTTKRFEYNLIMEEKSNSFFSFSPHLPPPSMVMNTLVQLFKNKYFWITHAYLVIMWYCWDFIIFQNSFKVKKNDHVLY